MNSKILIAGLAVAASLMAQPPHGPRGFGPGGPGRRPTRTSIDGVLSPGGALLARRERLPEIVVSDVATGLDLLTVSGASAGPSAVVTTARNLRRIWRFRRTARGERARRSGRSQLIATDSRSK